MGSRRRRRGRRMRRRGVLLGYSRICPLLLLPHFFCHSLLWQCIICPLTGRARMQLQLYPRGHPAMESDARVVSSGSSLPQFRGDRVLLPGNHLWPCSSFTSHGRRTESPHDSSTSNNRPQHLPSPLHWPPLPVARAMESPCGSCCKGPVEPTRPRTAPFAPLSLQPSSTAPWPPSSTSQAPVATPSTPLQRKRRGSSGCSSDELAGNPV
jgi:hypothetical protein